MSGDHTTTSVGATPIALQSWPADSAKDEKLVDKLARISQQNRQFRHVSEQELLKTIADEEAGVAQDDTGDEAEDGDSLEKRKQHIKEQRGEMFRAINEAQQSVLYIKDFLALMLSGSSHRAAQTMSPAVREAGVAPGSVAFDKWPVRPPTESQQKQRDLAAKGWRMQGLTASMDSILQSSVKLNDEVRKETKYWNQILNIADKGWSVRRTREPGTLGVQFGFTEAGPLFEKRGFAPLRSSEDGNIILDPRLVRRPQCVRVRISQHGRILGSSRQADLTSKPLKDRELEDLILRARDSLFEEELFHEMTMESRQLLSYNVRFRDHVIVLPADLTKASSLDGQSQRQILIDLVPLDEPDEQSDGHSEDQFAENILLGLRLLLTHSHSQKLLRRSQLPPLLTDRERPASAPPIIRTLLAHLYHHTATYSLRTYFHTYSRALRTAGLFITASTTPSTALANLSRTVLAAPSTARIPLLDAALATLSHSLTSTTTFTLSSRDPATITTRTALAPPTHGTEISIRVPRALATVLFTDDAAAGAKEIVFTDVGELVAYLDYCLSLDLAHNVAGGMAGKNWEALERRGELVRVGASGKARRKSKAGSGAKSADEATSMVIEVVGGRLEVSCFGADGAAAPREKVVWTADGRGPRESFEGVVRRFAGVE